MMKKKTLTTHSKTIQQHLLTVRDFVRYAESQFSEAELVFGHGTFSADQEAVFLVMESLRLPLEHLEVYLDARLLPAEKQKIIDLVEARIKTRKPLPYLLNRAYLQGHAFYIDERVIIPRSFISELLFTDVTGGEGYNLIDEPFSISRVLDLCTGSGCLAVLAAEAFPNAEVDAADLSRDALAVARINIEASNYADRINLYQGDLFAPMKGKKYDLIITNPPYVSAESMRCLPKEYRYEPKMALASGADGLDIVRRILKEAPSYLEPDGCLLCEIGTGRPILEEQYPDIEFLWLDTQESEGEVFFLTRDQLMVAKESKRAKA